MPLELDARRIAMLEEMGIRVWHAPLQQAEPAKRETAAPINKPVPTAHAAPPVPRIEGQTSATWLVVGDAPGSFDGDAAILLDRMLLAVGRSRTGEGDGGARLVYAVSGTGSQPFTAEALAAGRQNLLQEVRRARPAVILALGRHAIAALLDTTEPIGSLRGREHAFDGMPVIVSYPVQHLIRQPEAKARAWEDLCTAAQLSQV